MTNPPPTYIDPLTGLLNYEVFALVAEQYTKIAKRFEYSIVVIVLDIDNLKRINAEQGRAEGDWALKQVATIMQSQFRESDVVGRLDADRFAFLAMGVRDKDAEALAARLNEGLAQAAQAAGRTYTLSVSAGMAWNRFDAPLPLADVLAQANEVLAAQQQRKRGNS